MTLQWFGYVYQLDGRERDELLRVWAKATPEARKALLARLPELAMQAAVYRDKIERERAIEKYKVENRPMAEAEVQFFESYYLTLRGAKRKEARYRWRNTDNRGRRLYLKEVALELQQQEDLEEDMRDDTDEIEMQKEAYEKYKREKAAKEKAAKDKKDKEEKDKKAKEAKEKKEKEEKLKKDKGKDQEEDREELAAIEQPRPRVTASSRR
jgi:hypothetical protein